MNYTFSEKILSHFSQKKCQPGDYAIVPVHMSLASDTTAPAAIRAFKAMNGQKLAKAETFHLVIDHAAPAPTSKIANLHQLMRVFAAKTDCQLHDVGKGICHHVMIEEGHARQDEIILGADSHSCSYGAIGAFSTGIGSTDLAGIMKTGQTWLQVPRSIKIDLVGRLAAGVTGKDLCLQLHKTLCDRNIDTSYTAIELWDKTQDRLSLYQRLPICNMAIEMGAKSTVYINPTKPGRFHPDKAAKYHYETVINVELLQPKIALPSSPDRVTDVCQVSGTKISLAFLGSCTNNSLEDLHAAAKIMKGRQLAHGVRLLVAPPTRNVLVKAMADGTMQTILEAGATLLPSGCGPCVGTHLGVPSDGEVVISSANRNFLGRMGNREAQVFLSSAETVAASAITGTITDPRDFGPDLQCGDIK